MIKVLKNIIIPNYRRLADRGQVNRRIRYPPQIQNGTDNYVEPCST